MSRRLWLRGLPFLLLQPPALWAGGPEPLAVRGGDMRPGLHAVYRSLEPEGGSLERIDARPAFTWGHSSPHPRLPPGRFEVVWRGLLAVEDQDSIVLDALVGGEVKIEVAGGVYLDGRGESDWARVRSRRPMELRPGLHSFRVTFRSPARVPARLQIGWEGKTFSREPLPPWRLKHLPAELGDSAGRDAAAEEGRRLAERYGCAGCHPAAFPGLQAPPPGPSLADVGRRVSTAWLSRWLARPHEMKTDARMPGLFSDQRAGLVERWMIAEYLTRGGAAGSRHQMSAGVQGDHRAGRDAFLAIGCVACHFVPETERAQQEDLGRTALVGLRDRFSVEDLASFLLDPRTRYPDGRMPRIPLGPGEARDLAAYLLMWSKASLAESGSTPEVSAKEMTAVAHALGVSQADAGAALIRRKRCASCHAGLGAPEPDDVPIHRPEAGCLSDATLPRFGLIAEARKQLTAFLRVSAGERYASPFHERQERLRWTGCVRCHARDNDRSPPIEVASSTLASSGLEHVPYLRAPRLTDAFAKYTATYLAQSLRKGVSGVHHDRYSFRMPVFGDEAGTLVQAIAEGEGALPVEMEPRRSTPADPTLAGFGPNLVGFDGYSCVSCHVWNGQLLNRPDPGAIGPDLTSVTRRIRRDWFDRWLEDPARVQPGTPMPQIFPKGHPAPLASVLDGDARKHRDALWTYLDKGKEAPNPRRRPPRSVNAPPVGAPPLVALIPVTLPDGKVIEGVCVLYPSHDLAVFDIATMRLAGLYEGARLLRNNRRWNAYSIQGTPVRVETAGPPAARYRGYDRLPDGVAIRGDGSLQKLRLLGRTFSWEIGSNRAQVVALPPAHAPPPLETGVLSAVAGADAALAGSLERPGYRAFAYPRPKTEMGDDLVMPGAVAIHPRDGRVFVASMKLGEIFVLRDPSDNGRGAWFEDYAGGLFHDAYAMMAETDGLYVLHRRNLTKVVEQDGKAARFDRVAALPHGVVGTYDYAYGLARDRSGAFVMSFAPHANRALAGSGSMLRFAPGKTPDWEEVAFGFRNPIGWSSGPDGDIFFTDNQGEWVATNRLCHIVKGRYYGFPNPAQRQHEQKPPGKTAVWVPYGWARSINGVSYDATGGKFGPFAGQFFLAELMYGGAIIRAQVEKVNGEYQGAAFPFWGKGLLGPLTLAFDPKGRLWVGAITEPDWMAQPDRGALYRIDFTGQTPFEIQEIHVLPRGFRLTFTGRVDTRTAASITSYSMEHWRYEYTGAYGSPELDRTQVSIEHAELAPDGRTVDLTTEALVKDRVYLIAARGVKSADGGALVNPAGAYTLNEIPGPLR